MNDETKTEIMPSGIAVRDQRAGAMQPSTDQLPPGAPASYALVRLAVEKGLPIDQLQELLKLHREEEDRQARRAYVAAMASCKAELQTVLARDKRGDIGKYTTLGAAVELISPVMGKFGLSFDHPLEQNEQTGRMKVTCRVTHAEGHCESFSISLFADKGPRRNACQEVGSAYSYGKRYTLFAAMGIASSDEDNDGAGAPKTAPAAKPDTEKSSALPERAQRVIAAFGKWGVDQKAMEAGVGKPVTEWGDAEYKAFNDHYHAINKLGAPDREAEARRRFKLEPEQPREREAGEEG